LTKRLDESKTLVMTLGHRLAHARALVPDLSARQLSVLAALASPGHVEGIESGRAPNPTTSTLRALAEALGCSLDWLVNGDDPQPTAERVQAAVAAARAKHEAAEAAKGAA
jgi:transcriptional regulator with XRE-family HTH domain